jgi:hypothetical protein
MRPGREAFERGLWRHGLKQHPGPGAGRKLQFRFRLAAQAHRATDK